MPPRGMTTSLRVATATQSEPDDEDEVPVPLLYRRKRHRGEASTSAPPLIPTLLGQTSENVEVEEGRVGSYANLWSDPDQVPDILISPRNAFHEVSATIRRQVLNRTHAQLARATKVVADFGLIFEELDAANDQNKELVEKLQQAEEARQEAQDEAERCKSEIEHAETARIRAKKAKEQSDKAAEAFQKQLEESEAKIKELEEQNKFLENECAGAVEDTWNNCLTQIRFHFPNAEIDESRISRFQYIDNGVVMTLVDNVPMPVYPEGATPDVPLDDDVDA